jgi:hypothetical protein
MIASPAATRARDVRIHARNVRPFVRVEQPGIRFTGRTPGYAGISSARFIWFVEVIWGHRLRMPCHLAGPEDLSGSHAVSCG